MSFTGDRALPAPVDVSGASYSPSNKHAAVVSYGYFVPAP